jgi:hypothetical protein
LLVFRILILVHQEISSLTFSIAVRYIMYLPQQCKLKNKTVVFVSFSDPHTGTSGNLIAHFFYSCTIYYVPSATNANSKTKQLFLLVFRILIRVHQEISSLTFSYICTIYYVPPSTMHTQNRQFGDSEFEYGSRRRFV